MKKLIWFFALGIFLCTPFIAHAVPLGTGTLNVYWSYPYSGGSPNYYTDYDGKVVSSDFGYATGLEEIFCVSKEDANRLEDDITFYAITDDLDNFQKLSQAAWIADNWMTFATPTTNLDILKGEAQKAVWEVTGVVYRVGSEGIDYDILQEAKNHSGYLTSNWYWADSKQYQDYLTPVAPVPEPATMLLLGTGLIGLAGLGRKKFIK